MKTALLFGLVGILGMSNVIPAFADSVNYGLSQDANTGKVTGVQIVLVGTEAESIYQALAQSYPAQVITTDRNMNPEIKMQGLTCGVLSTSNGPSTAASPQYSCYVSVTAQ
jgi:hypothetical protein